MLAVNTLLLIALGIVAIVRASVTAPSSTTVWTEGAQEQITWQSISASELTIVLNRINSVYHHTIVSYTPNDGIYTWQVEIPASDGWPSSTASEQVYQLDFYVNGGWNNGGQLLAQSNPFAIVWDTTGGSITTVDPDVTPDPTAIVIAGGYTVRTEIIVGAITYTSLITESVETTMNQQTNTVTCTAQSPNVATVTTATNGAIEPTVTTNAPAFVTTNTPQGIVISGSRKATLPVILEMLTALVCACLVLL
jgi:Kre9/KNH-like N-terminal Ig-like domain